MRFRSSKLTELNKEYQNIHQNYLEHQKTIVVEVIQTASINTFHFLTLQNFLICHFYTNIGSYSATLLNLSGTLAKLDVLTSFAMLAASSLLPYVRPNLQPQGTGLIKLMQVRHPCVELQDSVSYIPNDVYFEQGEVNIYII